MNDIHYACYRQHRERSPEIPPEVWAKVLPDVPAMERRYQDEINAYANAKQEPRWVREANTGGRDPGVDYRA